MMHPSPLYSRERQGEGSALSKDERRNSNVESDLNDEYSNDEKPLADIFAVPASCALFVKNPHPASPYEYITPCAGFRRSP